MNHDLPPSLQLEEDTLINFNKLQLEKQANHRIMTAFVITFGGFVFGIIFLFTLLQTNYSHGVLITGFLFGFIYYLAAFIKWTNMQKRPKQDS